MQITELKVTIGEVCEGYINDAEEGVVGYDDVLIFAQSISESSFIKTSSGTR